jgi:hypothetical protein
MAEEDRERGVYVGGEGMGGGLSTAAEATGGDIVDDEVVSGGRESREDVGNRLMSPQ